MSAMIFASCNNDDPKKVIDTYTEAIKNAKDCKALTEANKVFVDAKIDTAKIDAKEKKEIVDKYVKALQAYSDKVKELNCDGQK